MKLRPKSLDLSRFSLADFCLSLDADVLLSDPHVVQHRSLQQLLGENVGDFLLLRTEDYRKILNRKKVGCHEDRWFTKPS